MTKLEPYELTKEEIERIRLNETEGISNAPATDIERAIAREAQKRWMEHMEEWYLIMYPPTDWHRGRGKVYFFKIPQEEWNALKEKLGVK